MKDHGDDVLPDSNDASLLNGNRHDESHDMQAFQPDCSTGPAVKQPSTSQLRLTPAEIESPQPPPAKTTIALCSTYAMAAWAWRSWEFTVALILTELYPDSLLLVSIYGLLDNLVRVLFGSYIGKYIDRKQRLPGACNMYILQNTCIAISAASAFLLLSESSDQQRTDSPQVFWPLIVVTLLLGALSSLGSTGITIGVEKEMVKALCGGDRHALGNMNSVMRAIDLVCLLAAPISSGVLMTYCSPPVAVAVLAAYAIGVWIPELYLLQLAVNSSAALRAPKDVTVRDPGSLQAAGQIMQAPGDHYARSRWFWSLRLYWRQDVLLANLALALLYMTVLSLGFLMTSFLLWTGETEAVVSIYRGFGALTGLLATVLFPVLHSKLGVKLTGMFGSYWQLACLSLGVVPMLLDALLSGPADGSVGTSSDGRPGPWVVRMLVAGLVCSRTGLWMFDLAVTQLVQEHVALQELGAVCGVQSSIQAFFETLSFVAGIYFQQPSQFYWLMAGSLGVVAMACVLYTVYVVSSKRKEAGYQPVAEQDASDAA